MHPLDLATITLYLLAILGLGAYFGRHQSRREFFSASRSMGYVTVGLSVMATLFSSNSFVMYPSAAFGDSLRIGLSLVAFSLMTPIVVWVFIPVYSRLEIETAYQYLECRFHVSVRTLASGLFVLLRIGWMASATYAASLVVASVSGLDQTAVIVGLGSVSIAYTMMGGLRAVMWTDVLQFFVFAVTILATLALILAWSDVGVSEVFTTYFANRSGLLVDFTPSLTLPFGSWAILIGVFLEGLSAFGVDQVAVQRYLAARSERASRVGAWINLAGMWVVLPGLLAIGVGLYSWFNARPAELLGEPGRAQEAAVAPFAEPMGELTMGDLLKADPKLADRALPEFVRLHFPPGLAGLFLAALMAAIMSSIDSGVHSVTTALVVDFRDRLVPAWRPSSERHEVLWIRVLVLAIGAISVVLACFVGPLGNVFDIGKKMTAAFGGPLLALFLLALFCRRASSLGVLISVVAATLATLGLMYTQPWFSVWYWPVGFGLALGLGYASSWLLPAAESEFTYWRIMRGGGR